MTLPYEYIARMFLTLRVHNLVLDFGYTINSTMSSVDFQRSKNFSFQLIRIDFMSETYKKHLYFTLVKI